ncbi:MAG: FAD-dependent oxidoreductase, partial [Intrasporangiaceae bacterium]|nr:FAD-dependent oxidoreductase [Intrasporangiaceae bacterium]
METIDYAVVGAGCGGVYAAWRLREDRPSATVRVLEASGRVGGRLESLVPPGAPHLRAEFGGMGFDTNHLLVEAVVDALSLPTAPFPSSGPAYAWLRGVPLFGSQLTDASAIPYRLPPGEQGQSFASLLASRVNADLGIDVGTMTHADWLQVGRHTRVLGTPLRDIGFWNYLATILSAEGFAYVQDTMGHDFPVENFNALDMLEWFFADFAPGTTDTTLAGGYDQLPTAIAERFEAAGGQLSLDTEVVRVTRAGDGTFKLALRDGCELGAKAVI